MDEPSVLDYIKAKLMPWKGEQITIPDIDEEKPEVFESIAPPPPKSAIEIIEKNSYSKKITIKWRLILSLILVLVAQRFLEPPERNLEMAVALYAIVTSLLILAILNGELIFQPLTPGTSLEITGEYRQNPLILSLPFAVVTFLSFGGNLFTSLNLLLWLLTLSLAILGLWISRPSHSGDHLLERIGKWIKNPCLVIRITPWGWLIIGATIMVIFFRLYWLDKVPGEMFSDHAEKLLDVADVLQGQTHIFFPRNTGREAIQMYLTAGIAILFGTGLSYMSLKIGTAIAGLLTLPYIYLLGKEVGNRWVGLLALILAGIGYWPNLIARVGLRFPLYPLFVAPTLYYLIKGLRTSNRNDFILCGLALGLGLHGYSPFRFVPFVILLAFTLYIIHDNSKINRIKVIWGLAILVFISFLVFLPLFRYTVENPEMFAMRAFSRMGETERPFPAPVSQIFFSNLWSALVMPFWHNGDIWVHSVIGRPALDVVTAAMYFLGFVLFIARYLRQRQWVDLFLLLSIPLLMMPSILSLAFPDENPSLNRTGGAIIPIFIIAAYGMQSILSSLASVAKTNRRFVYSAIIGILLISWSAMQNYNLVFNQFNNQFMRGAWNTTIMGKIIRSFAESIGDPDSAYVVPYPYWVDTRLIGINAGYPTKDYALWPEQFQSTLNNTNAKLFLVKADDLEDLEKLRLLYPQGASKLYTEKLEGKDFYQFFVPPSGN